MINKDSELEHQGNHFHDIFSNPEMLVEKFDAPERDEWQKPDEVIASFNLSDDATVVEIGSSTGVLCCTPCSASKQWKNNWV